MYVCFMTSLLFTCNGLEDFVQVQIILELTNDHALLVKDLVSQPSTPLRAYGWSTYFTTNLSWPALQRLCFN